MQSKRSVTITSPVLCLTIVFTAHLATAPFAGFAAEEDGPVVGVRIAESKSELLFTISNKWDTDLLLRRSNVPWLFPKCVKLVLIQTNSATTWTEPIPMLMALMDPPVGRVKIGAHNDARGALNLGRFFPQLSETLHTNDVLVFWEYLLIDLTTSRRFQRSGSAVIVAEKRRAPIGE